MAFGLGERCVEAGGLVGGGQDRAVERLHLVGQAGERLGGVGGERAFARAIVGDAAARLVQFAHPARGGGALRAERGEAVAEIVGGVARGERGGAGGGDGGHGVGLRGGGDAFGVGRLGDAGVGGGRFGARGVGGGGGVAPAGKDHARFGEADLRRQLAIAFGGAGLAAQGGGARVLIGDQFAEAFEVRFGRAQFLFGVLAADVEAGDPRRLLQHRAAFGGFGRDDRTDPVLADERGAVCAGGGVGEQ